ncbi:hypothetical protein FQR65_LT19745 [Abscondita terminalis]|nr:hypothetical protein FQR65_LT19745 [Abscondita terminalis]
MDGAVHRYPDRYYCSWWAVAFGISESFKGEGWQEISGSLVLGGVAAAMVGAVFSSVAWENVTFVAGEMDNPKRNVVRAMVLGTALVMVLYLFCNFVYLAALGRDEIAFAEKDRVAVAAAEKILGHSGTIIMAILVMISTFGCVNGRRPGQDLNKAFKSGMELFERGKFSSAAKQFDKVEEIRTKSTLQLDENEELTLLKENVTLLSRPIWVLRAWGLDAEGRFFEKELYFLQTRIRIAERPESEYQEASIYYYAYLCYLDAEYKTALNEFERLQGSKTYESSYPYYITALYFLDKRYDDVLNYALPILQTTKQDNETDMFRVIAATYFIKGDLKKSKEYYDKFQSRDQGKTQNNQDSYQIGYINYKLGDYDKAITELEKMSQPDGILPKCDDHIGKNAFLKKGNKQSARNAFFRASKLDFDAETEERRAFELCLAVFMNWTFHQVALDAIQRWNVLESVKKEVKEANAAYQEGNILPPAVWNIHERAFENAISMLCCSEANRYDEEDQMHWLFNMESRSMYDGNKARITALFAAWNYSGLLTRNSSGKIATLQSVVQKYPKSNYADDVAFEIPYTYFTLGQYDQAISGSQKSMVEKNTREAAMFHVLW